MKKIAEAFLTGIVLFFAGCIFLLSNHIGGWRAFVVLSPSMEPAVATGSLVITQQIPPGNLKVGDIITFTRPDKTREFITHRIVSIAKNSSVAIIHTKGDKNVSPDAWVLAGGGVIGKVIYSMPHLGYILSLSKTKIGIAIFILIPAVIILYLELTNVFTLLHALKRKKGDTPQTGIVMIFLFIFLLQIFSVQPTYALLSDKASLTGNTFTIAIPSNDCNIGSTTIIKTNNSLSTTIAVSAINSGSSSATATVNQIVNTTRLR